MDLQHKPNTGSHKTLTTSGKPAQKYVPLGFWFEYVHFVQFFPIFLNGEFWFCFSIFLFAIISLLCAPSFFILYIIYLFENLCLWLHFDCHRCRSIYLYDAEWRTDADVVPGCFMGCEGCVKYPKDVQCRDRKTVCLITQSQPLL